MRVTRRGFLRGAAAVSVGWGAFPAVLRAQPRTIKIGMVEPVSGPMADVGQDARLGGQMAVEAVNAAGGIKSMGGARLELLDRARIDEGFARTGHTIVPLVWELSRIVGEPYGGWVHWGATTQNITQTGDLLVLRQAHRSFLG